METLDPECLWSHQGSITLEERAYRCLRDAITAGLLSPGTRLVGAHVADRLGVSRTTSANAIKRLATEGLIVYRPHSDASVSSLDDATLHEVFLIRHALEEVIMREATTRVDQGMLDQLARINDGIVRSITNDDPDSYRRNERDYHMLIYAAANMPMLATILTELWNRIEPYRGRRYTGKALLHSTVREHEVIESALAAGDQEAAIMAMREHVQTGHAQLAEVLRRETEGWHTRQHRNSTPPRRMSTRPLAVQQSPPRSLRSAFQAFHDPRRRQGKMFDLPGLMTLVTCAMLCGARSGYAVTRWGQRCHPEIRAALGLPHAQGPSGATIHRVLNVLDRDEFVQALCRWLETHDIRLHEMGTGLMNYTPADGNHGVHGEELPGIEVIATLASAFRSVSAGDSARLPAELHEVLSGLPALILEGVPDESEMRIAALELRNSILERNAAAHA